MKGFGFRDLNDLIRPGSRPAAALLAQEIVTVRTVSNLDATEAHIIAAHAHECVR